MSWKVASIFLALALVSPFTFVSSNDRGYFCKAEKPNAFGDPPKFRICRKCPSLDEDCETSDDCQCDNIEVRTPKGNLDLKTV